MATPDESKDISNHVTKTSANRMPSPIRKLIPLLKVPGMISLGAGLPNPSLFPFSGISFQIKDGSNLSLSEQELNEALQYSPTEGLAGLVSWLTKLQKLEHNPIYDDSQWRVCVGTGSQDLLTKVFEMLTNEEDPILVETPSYGGALSFLLPRRHQFICIEIDEFGIIPDSLMAALESFEDKAKKPKVLYTVPTGQNPTGSTLSNERRTQVYNIACQHDVIIIEDDPYWYLNYGSGAAPERDSDYERPKFRSFFSMDAERRVIRLDTLSKPVSSGLRLGFATGPVEFMERLIYHGQSTYLHTSGVSQMITLKLLQHWKYEGFIDHVTKVQLFYKRRRDVALQCARRHLTGLAEWTVPVAGMFLWFNLKGVDDSSSLIEEQALAAKVMLIPGSAFSPTPNIPSSCVRASFSLATNEEMDEGFKRLAKMLRKVKYSKSKAKL